MAIITSRSVGVDTTANKPAAATAGRMYLPTTAGSNYLNPEYDTGAGWVPWRANTLVSLYNYHDVSTAVTATNAAWTTVFDATHFQTRTRMDLNRFRECRLIVIANLQPGSTSVDVRLYDVTNSAVMSNTLSFTSTTVAHKMTTWYTLGATTYQGTGTELYTDFEAQVTDPDEGHADNIKFARIDVEFR